MLHICFSCGQNKPSKLIKPYNKTKEKKKMDQTFSIIKPDATRRNITGSINKLIEESGLRIIAQKRIQLTNEQAESFYSVHKEKPFFRDLIEYMTSEPVVVQILSGENSLSWQTLELKLITKQRGL